MLLTYVKAEHVAQPQVKFFPEGRIDVELKSVKSALSESFKTQLKNFPHLLTDNGPI